MPAPLAVLIPLLTQPTPALNHLGSSESSGWESDSESSDSDIDDKESESESESSDGPQDDPRPSPGGNSGDGGDGNSGHHPGGSDSSSELSPPPSSSSSGNDSGSSYRPSPPPRKRRRTMEDAQAAPWPGKGDGGAGQGARLFSPSQIHEDPTADPQDVWEGIDWSTDSGASTASGYGIHPITGNVAVPGIDGLEEVGAPWVPDEADAAAAAVAAAGTGGADLVDGQDNNDEEAETEDEDVDVGDADIVDPEEEATVSGPSEMGESDVQGTENPFDPVALGLKELNNLGKFLASSYKPGNGVDQMLDDDTNLYWQYVFPFPFRIIFMEYSDVYLAIKLARWH